MRPLQLTQPAGGARGGAAAALPTTATARRPPAAPRAGGKKSAMESNIEYESRLEDTPGVDALLARDRRGFDLADAAAAFGDDGDGGGGERAAPPAPPPQQPQRASAPPPSDPAAPRRARDAIDAGIARFAAGDYRGALALFQAALELPGAGVYRLEGSPKEYSCPSDGEEQAALFNAACCYAALGEAPAALTVLEALLDAGFDDLAALRSDPDLAPLRGPALEALLRAREGPPLIGGLLKAKKKRGGENAPWLRW